MIRVHVIGVLALSTAAAAGVACVEPPRPHSARPVQAVIESLPHENVASKEPPVLYRGEICELNNRSGL